MINAELFKPKRLKRKSPRKKPTLDRMLISLINFHT
jgi:hypothetical protein